MIAFLQSRNDAAVGLMIWAVIAGFYLFFAMIPYFIARSRNHKQAVPILLCALFFPFVGWIAALIWAYMTGPNQGGYREKRTFSRRKKVSRFKRGH